MTRVLATRRHCVGVLAVAALTTGCERSRYVRVRPTIEDQGTPSEADAQPSMATLASVVSVKDEALTSQLVSGFYGIEQGAWRWTMGHFAVLLEPPLRSQRNGATLRLEFVLPDAVLNRIHQTTLHAQVGPFTPPPETYRDTGEHAYVREVPATAFSGQPVTVSFQVNPFVAAGVLEQRELALIVTRVGLEPK